MLRLDGATGEVLWSQHYASPEGTDETVFALAVDSEDNPIVAGRAYNGSHGDDLLVLKLASWDGGIIWVRFVDGGSNLDDRAWDLVIDSDDDAIVTGVTGRPDGSAEFITLKLDGSDGATLWSRVLPGAVENIEERGGWLAICDDGDVVMANRTWTSGTSFDIVLHRYEAGSGSTEWAVQQGSGGTVVDDPRDMIRDGSGDLLVVGVTGGNFMVRKFRQEDGSLAWSSTYDGPAGWYDLARCVAEGPQGEVIATGFCSDAVTGWDVATVAYAPEDGAQLWAEQFDSGDGETDEGGCITVSSLGDLYVVGYGYGVSSDSDLLTLCYRLGSSAGLEGITAMEGFRIAPNPATSMAWFDLPADLSPSAVLAVFDARGRLVAKLLNGTGLPARGTVAWDLRRPGGERLPGGVYFARLRDGSRNRTARVVLAR